MSRGGDVAVAAPLTFRRSVKVLIAAVITLEALGQARFIVRRRVSRWAATLEQQDRHSVQHAEGGLLVWALARAATPRRDRETAVGGRGGVPIARQE